jgi:hypothetical protein
LSVIEIDSSCRNDRQLIVSFQQNGPNFFNASMYIFTRRAPVTILKYVLAYPQLVSKKKMIVGSNVKSAKSEYGIFRRKRNSYSAFSKGEKSYDIRVLKMMV